jgi:hypothetical protein
VAQQLDLTLDRQSDVPLGTQLVWKLRAAIGAGRLRPGDHYVMTSVGLGATFSAMVFTH